MISKNRLTWPQAQYECLARRGHLAELVSSDDISDLAKVLQQTNITGKYWVGASDLEDQGHFRWFHNGTRLNSKDLKISANVSNEQLCVQIGSGERKCKFVKI